MAKTHIIRFRVSREQFERLQARTKVSNKLTISDYLRYVALEQPLIYDKICENNGLLRELLGNPER